MTAFNLVLVQGNNNFKRSVVYSYTGENAEKEARSDAARMQWEEDDRYCGSSPNYFQVEEKKA